MIDKRVAGIAAAVQGIASGATVLCGGFGSVGEPVALIEALSALDLRELVLVANTAGNGDVGIARLIAEGRVRKIVCTYPRSRDPYRFEAAFKAGKIELELVAQGILSERVRAAGAGLAGFYTRVGAGTRIAEGKESRIIDGQPHILEMALKADVALIRAHRADRWGNLVYRKAARNFNPVFATGAPLTVAQVSEIVELGALDPETIVTPGIFVDRVVVA